MPGLPLNTQRKGSWKTAAIIEEGLCVPGPSSKHTEEGLMEDCSYYRGRALALPLNTHILVRGPGYFEICTEFSKLAISRPVSVREHEQSVGSITCPIFSSIEPWCEARRIVCPPPFGQTCSSYLAPAEFPRFFHFAGKVWNF